MLAELLRQAAEEVGERHFFRFDTRSYTYADAYAESFEFAERLNGWGVQPGDVLALDLGNSDDLVFLLFGGSILGASFFLLNHRLPDARKAALLEGFSVNAFVDEPAVARIREAERRPLRERQAGRFPDADPDSVFVRMFTSGTSGRPKAAALTYRNLIGAAEASAAAFMQPGAGDWQLVLPMYHVGGLQILVRSLVNRSAFTLYARFEAPLVLRDVAERGATHISVVDRMLRELRTQGGPLLDRYELILLGGGPRNEQTLCEIGSANLFPSYGMTETSATVAASPLAESTDGGMRLLPGYDVAIIEPDDSGTGEIAVSGPGVFPGYVSPVTGPPAARGLFRDGHFLTGDRGRVEGGRLFVRERLGDMFVSGGENVYPAEIELELRAVPGVTDARVIGVDDAEWGRRPVAFVAGEGLSETEIGGRLEHRLARFQRPDSVFLLDELPATAIGKVDTRELHAMWDRRLDVREVHLYRISQPLKTPFANSQVTMTERESIIVEVVDHQGRSGFGECVAFSTPWYTPETIEGAWRVLADELAPTVLGTTYLHPRDVFSSLSGVRDNLMAKGSIEPAFWDLYGRITGEPLHALLGATTPRALAGVSLGILPVDDTIDEIRRYVAKGYSRVKLKISPGDDVERMSRVRDEFPDLMLMADANQAYTAEQVDALRGLDPLGLVCIEEPLASPTPSALNALQSRLSTPICVDETIRTERDLQAVLLQPDLRNINLKIGKFGGVTPSLELYRTCRERGIVLWLGGMYETGVSKYLHAHFETLDGIDIPGDISETARYFERDIVVPEVRVVDGEIVLPEGPGLAFQPDRERIRELSTDHVRVSA